EAREVKVCEVGEPFEEAGERLQAAVVVFIVVAVVEECKDGFPALIR
ncbi:hypothetical protein A2U01_0087928, partial [Trifolium medium]|nr:hypothetical protein [Trifolium medium]